MGDSIHSELIMSSRARGGACGNKFRVTLGLPVAAVLNCADNTGAKNIYIMSVSRIKGRLNRIPSATIASRIISTVKRGKPELRKKVSCGVVIRQRQTWRRPTGETMSCEDNAAILFSDDGKEPKGSSISGPVCKEVSDVWPKIAAKAQSIV